MLNLYRVPFYPLQAAVGSLVWLEDPDAAWIDGEVLEVKGDDLKVLCTSGKTVSVTKQTFFRYYLDIPFFVYSYFM